MTQRVYMGLPMTDETIESVSHETACFAASGICRRGRAGIREAYEAMYRRSIEEPEAF